MLSDDYGGYTAVQDIRNPDLTVYGVESGTLAMGAADNDENSIVTLLEPNCPLNEEQLQILTGEIDPLSNSSNFGVDIYLRAINCVARILDPPAQSTRYFSVLLVGANARRRRRSRATRRPYSK